MVANLDDRKIKEIEHSDQRRKIVTGFEYNTDTSSDTVKRDYVNRKDEYDYHFSNMKFYSITRKSFEHRDHCLYSGIQNKTVLDYCCGNGEVALEMAKQGAKKVYGIDISQVAVDNAINNATRENVNDRCIFQVMDAENTTFTDSYFDIIHEYGALHHLDLDAALKELSRIVKPGGSVICTEALKHNPVIHKYRKRTPHLRTKWEYEHILGVNEILKGKKYFENLSIRFFHLSALAAVPFRKTKIFSNILCFLDSVDEILLRVPYLQQMAWVAVYKYSNPIK